MRRAASLALFALLLLPSGSSRAASQFGRVTTVQVPRNVDIEEATLADCNGDGLPDLLLETWTHHQNFHRRLSVYFRRRHGTPFASEPDCTLDFFPGDIAFAPADVDPEPGKEIVIFTARGAYAWRPGAPNQKAQKLLTANFLWQLPDPRDVFLFSDGIRDVDGDGLDDILIPKAGGYDIFFQTRAKDGTSSFHRSSDLSVPDYEPVAGRETIDAARQRLKDLRSSLALGGNGAGGADLVDVRHTDPYPVLTDFDGDGRRDLLAETSSELLVWLQRSPRTFSRLPDLTLPLPVRANTSRRLDVSFSAHAVDLDGDGKADYVIVAGDRHSEKARTQVLVYSQKKGALFGAKGLPRQALFIGGFAALLGLSDVDDNGLPDLVMGRIQVDTLDAIRSTASGDVDADVLVYLNHGGRFSSHPDLSYHIPIPVRNIHEAGKALTARFVGDIAGTGASDLLVRDNPGHLKLVALRRKGRGLDVFPQPLFQTAINDHAGVRVRGDKKHPEILVIEKHQVLVVDLAP